MKAFEFKRGDQAWPDGETLLHVYALPDLSRDQQLASLIDGCRRATTGYPLTYVTDAWLHITLAQIPDTVARLIPPDQRQLLAQELQAALAVVAPFTVTIGSCLSYSSGLICDVSPDDELGHLHDLISSVIGRVRGPAATTYNVGVPHLTLAYANGDADSDDIQRKLRRVRPSHAPMTIRSVHLLDVAADPDAKTITWTTPLAEINLGQP